MLYPFLWNSLYHMWRLGLISTLSILARDFSPEMFWQHTYNFLHVTFWPLGCSGTSMKILWLCLHSGIVNWDDTALHWNISPWENFGHYSTGTYNTWTFCPKYLMCHYVSKLECPRFWNIPVLKYSSAKMYPMQISAVVTALWCNESPILEGLWGPTFFPSAYRRRDQHPELKNQGMA